MSHEKFRALFDHSSDPHLIFDASGITDCNDAAIRILGCRSRQEVLSLHPAELSPERQPDGRPSVEKAEEMDALARKQGFHRFEWWHRKVTGELFPVEVTLNPIIVGEHPSLVVVWHDLTERKQREENLRSLNEKLRSANERMKRDLDAAARIQQGFLPQRLPRVEGIRFGWHYRPSAEVGGDFLGVRSLPGERTLLFLLDVTGHGVPAALLSVSISHLFDRDAASSDWELGESPEEIVSALNRRFTGGSGDVQFFTMFCGLLEHRTRKLTWVSAGHPPATVVNDSREPRSRRLESTAMPVGILSETEFHQEEIVLQEGDRLLILSDGLIEAMNPGREPFGDARLLEVFTSADASDPDARGRELVAAVERWCGPAGPADDVSLIIVEIDAPSSAPGS